MTLGTAWKEASWHQQPHSWPDYSIHPSPANSDIQLLGPAHQTVDQWPLSGAMWSLGMD